MSYKANILVIDDDPIVGESCEITLTEEGHTVKTAFSGKEALEKIKGETFDLALIDLKMPEMDGIEVLQAIKKSYPEITVIMITGYPAIETAVKAQRLGAFDYVLKPFTPEELNIVVARALDNRELIRENQRLRQQLQDNYKFNNNIVGNSKSIQEIYTLIEKVAPTDSTILIYGESGTGKEVIARAIHQSSLRRDKQFVTVDCAVLSENLLESELFGHVKGSFTGATMDKPGLFEIASGGTMFLDEIGNISLSVQKKLLRVLQEREFMRVGGTEVKKVDIRLIAATNRNLEAMVAEETFREDLFYRLNIVPIYLPPLRERKQDIPILACHFLEEYSKEANKNVSNISPEAMALLVNYNWPGNIRELENLIERIVVTIDEKTVLPGQLSFIQSKANNTVVAIPRTSDELKEIKKTLREKAVEDVERLFVVEALKRNGWNVTRAAEDVGMLRQNFQTLMRKYHVHGPSPRPSHFD
ncbi:sigma-54-dependent Fis family transcriptional regulator [Candidatus Poribacteria bacterium]|nr:sigma-54-dependent Fis family transcriptional regulator [Candidatus Poribacteria bacterium]